MENHKTESKAVKFLLIGISVLFLFVMLVLPLFVVVTEALKKGWQIYVEAVTDSYTIDALMLTLKATVIAVLCNTFFGLCAAWAVTRFQFKGKKILTTLIDVPVTVSPIIAGLIYLLVFGKQSILYPYLQKAGIQIVFAVPGIILATVFVTFPFVFRELLPVLESIGTDEEEAAALMGAKGWTIFRRLHFHISNGHFCTASSCVRQGQWENLALYQYCPDISEDLQIHCRCMWRFYLMNFSMYRHSQYHLFW